MGDTVFPEVTEKKARKIVDKGGDVVFIHTRANCPICDTFLPDVLKPVFEKEKYKHIPIYQITESMVFPVGQHPITYFFKDGRCIQHPAGQTSIENVEQLLNTFYLGEHTIDEWNQGQRNQGPPRQRPNPSPYRPPSLEINTNKKLIE